MMLVKKHMKGSKSLIRYFFGNLTASTDFRLTGDLLQR